MSKTVKKQMPELNEQLRMVVVGHVDHGKSTFVGRLLHDTNSLPDGKYEALVESCKKRGVDFEYAFLMDAFESERDQNITIDTAQIWFSTKKRQYCIIDAPGHKEFIKNMVTGAAQAHAALLMIAANEGVQEQSRRHGTLLSLLGINQVVVVVNKMDMVNYDQAVYDKIEKEYREFLVGLGVTPMSFIPISAREGDNVAKNTKNLDWYKQGTVLEQLDSFTPPPAEPDAATRYAIQDIYRFDERRILAGRIDSGKIKVGDKLVFHPGGKSSKVKTIERWEAAKSDIAYAGESIGITLEEQIFVERGHVGTHVESPLVSTHEIKARLFWLGKKPLAMGKRYKLKLATQEAECEIKEIRSIMNSSTLESSKEKVTQVEKNEVAELVLKTRYPVALDNHDMHASTGRFVIVDDKDVSGGGIIFGHAYADPDHVSTDIYYNEGEVNSIERAKLKGHEGAIVWLTGLSGSGKSTIANALEREMVTRGIHAYELDGDNLRFGLNRDLGFSKEGRQENIRRASEVARLFADSATVVITAFISPFKEDRAKAREIAKEHKVPFFEVHVNASIEVCEQRDPKGLYKKARAGEIAEFTGVSSPYEPPEEAELVLNTDTEDVGTCVTRILDVVLPQIRPKKK